MQTIVFNGDADGLCALQQLCLAERFSGARLVTGVKRDIDLVKRVEARGQDRVTVLDVSFDVNRAAVLRLLAAGAHVRYFDHHYAGEVPKHARLEAHIDPSPKACTSLIVDRYLKGACRAWAVVGAFGDNLGTFPAEETSPLWELGILLNYNAYGESLEDLYFPPEELHARLRNYREPLAFVREDAAFRQLRAGYKRDMGYGMEVLPEHDEPHAALYVLPATSWARRVSGVLASHLARRSPAKAIAVVLPVRGSLQVSVRAPLHNPRGAAALCREFPTGGGREGAAGINRLPEGDLQHFAARFLEHYGRAAVAASS